jgi:hypothetical protein
MPFDEWRIFKHVHTWHCVFYCFENINIYIHCESYQMPTYWCGVNLLFVTEYKLSLHLPCYDEAVSANIGIKTWSADISFTLATHTLFTPDNFLLTLLNF